MMPDSRRFELERHLLQALRHAEGSPAQRLMASGVQEALQQLFLEQSDVVLQPLLDELSQWQAGQRAGVSDAVVQGLARLSRLAQDQGLSAIDALSAALHQAVKAVGDADSAAATPSIPDCQQGAEELARLLFLYAAGQRRDVTPELLVRLRRQPSP